jgi:peptidoglycan/LPS O-acetylase OafA/YrhL
MQFYLTVPFFFLLFQFLDRVPAIFKVTVIGSIPLASFVFQTYSTGDSAHMLLTARFWQFFFGFAAHYAYESGVLNFVKREKDGRFFVCEIL